MYRWMGQVVYRWSDGNRWSDRLVELSYRWLGSERQSDRLMKMVYRWSDVDGWFDRLSAGWMGRTMDGLVAQHTDVLTD